MTQPDRARDPFDVAPARWIREQLGMAPEAYARLIEPLSEHELADDFGGTDGLPSLYQSMTTLEDFSRKTGLTLDETLALTAQDAMTVDANAVAVESVFYPAGADAASATNEYGATLICHMGPLFVFDGAQCRQMGWHGVNRHQQYRTVDQLIRLHRQTGLSFEQLDWLLGTARRTGAPALPTAGALIDANTLYPLACCLAMQRHFGLETDACAALMGELNVHAVRGKPSFYTRTFNLSPAGSPIAPGMTIDVALESTTPDLRATLAAGLKVSAHELYLIAQVVTQQEAPTKLIFTADLMGRFYRLATVPRLFSWSLAECVGVWNTLSGLDWATIVGGPATLDIFAVIERTRLVAEWMADNRLSATQLAAMLSRQVPTTATAAMFNFLANAAETAGHAGTAGRGTGACTMTLAGARTGRAMPTRASATTTPVASLLKLIGGAFDLKANVAAQVVAWHDASSLGADGQRYGLDAFWTDVGAVFGTAGATIDTLNGKPDLVRYCHSLSRYAMLVQWLALGEQELVLVVARPDYLDARYSAGNPPVPALDLLIVLTRLKAWGQRLTGGAEQGVRYFHDVDGTTNPAAAATRLAELHGWDSGQTRHAMALLFADQVPRTFTDVHALETMMRTAARLNVDVATVEAMRAMAGSDADAASPARLAAVANDLYGAVLAAAR